ncbi:putative calcium-binding protein CML41 [Silene latifolia]|uniref:putative calcium-binding protein CML41 n=1 Tax=Silene latifolia TaxID=37657 RepID=UPI003D7726E7
MATKCTSRSTRCFPNVGIRITLHKKKPKSPTTTTTTTSQNSSFSSRTSGSNSLTPRTTRTREDELKDVFRHFDIDQDGKISATELQRYFTTIGEIVSIEEAQEVIDELDSDKDGMLEFDDFVKLMMDTKEGGDNNNNEDLKKVFEMFVHEKGSGRITPRGLQRAMNRLGDPKSYNECVTMIQVYDIDGDGELDFNEFHHMMAA